MEYESYNKPRRAKKPMTEQQALLKLTTLCTQSEHCSQEMLDKMKKWELSEDAIARNMQFLTEKKFIDDKRYARFFINDKIKYNKWGRRKVEQALWMKHISKDISDPIFEEIEDELYMETLLPLMKNKYKTIKAKNDYERSMKLIRFALGRGYGMDIIHKCINKMKAEDLEDIDIEGDIDFLAVALFFGMLQNETQYICENHRLVISSLLSSLRRKTLGRRRGSMPAMPF